MKLETRLAAGAIFMALALPAMAQQGVPGGHFIENWDADGDGAVTLEEARQRREDVFYMFDADENGSLDGEEYAAFDETRAADMAQSPGHGQGMKGPNQGMTMEFNDADGNGVVTSEEFAGRTGDWFEMLDWDGDGTVTTADFGHGN